MDLSDVRIFLVWWFVIRIVIDMLGLCLSRVFVVSVCMVFCSVVFKVRCWLLFLYLVVIIWFVRWGVSMGKVCCCVGIGLGVEVLVDNRLCVIILFRICCCVVLVCFGKWFGLCCFGVCGRVIRKVVFVGVSCWGFLLNYVKVVVCIFLMFLL